MSLSRRGLKPPEIQAAFGGDDGLGKVCRVFLDFLQERCTPEERTTYMEALPHIQTGEMTGREARQSHASDEREGWPRGEPLLPNVRLVNSRTMPETRQWLMRVFNSPFFPEILITSNVLAEGVDLHRCCRGVIHHDLEWGPSVGEQRTGRVDRIGAKVEWAGVGRPIHVFLPYLAETQNEKIYRVVMDRERGFSVVMGEQFRLDARTTDQRAPRVPLPEFVARELAFQSEV